METSVFQDLLAEAQDAGRLVAIYTNSPDPYQSCAVGYVDVLNGQEVRLRSVSRHGEDSGYDVVLTDDILRVEVDGAYERKVEFLRAHLREWPLPKELPPVPYNESILLTTLRQARENRLVVSLDTEDEEQVITGFVHSVDAESVRILMVDTFGNDDGETAVRIAAIREMSCNSLADQALRFLNAHKSYREV